MSKRNPVGRINDTRFGLTPLGPEHPPRAGYQERGVRAALLSRQLSPVTIKRFSWETEDGKS